jgi:hypothetical protein
MLRKFCLAPLRSALFVLPCAPERLVASSATNGLRSLGTLGFRFISSLPLIVVSTVYVEVLLLFLLYLWSKPSVALPKFFAFCFLFVLPLLISPLLK